MTYESGHSHPMSHGPDSRSPVPGIDEIFGSLQSGYDSPNFKVDALVYRELRRLATTYMRFDRRDHHLQVTGLVHEAITRVSSASATDYTDARHYYATAARIMRRVLVDYAKARNANKSKRTQFHSMSNEGVAETEDGIDVVEMHESLEKLAKVSSETSQAIELRYFAGLTVPQIAQVMDTSSSTVKRHIRWGHAWLLAQISGKLPSVP